MGTQVRLYVGAALAVAAGVALTIAGQHEVGPALLTLGLAELGVKYAAPA